MTWAIEAYPERLLGAVESPGVLSVLIPTAAMTPSFEPYRGSLPATQVFSGDNAAAPVFGVQLIFTDEAEARSVLGWVEEGAT